MPEKIVPWNPEVVEKLKEMGDEARSYIYGNQDLRKAKKILLSLLPQAEEAGWLTGGATCLNQLGFIAIYESELDQAISYLEAALSAANKAEQTLPEEYHPNVFREIGAAHGGLSGAYLQLGKDDLAEYHDKLHIEYAEKSGSLRQLATAWQGYGVTLVKLSRFSEAIDTFLRSIEIAKSDDKEPVGGLLVHNYEALKACFTSLGDYDGALGYAYEALREAESLHQDLETAVAHDSLGEVRLVRKEFFEAREEYKLAIELFEKCGYEEYKLIAMVKLAEVEHGLGNIAEAEKLLIVPEAKAPNRGSLGIYAASLMRAKIQMSRGEYPNAIESLSTALANVSSDGVTDLLELLADAHARNGNHSEAWQFITRYNKEQKALDAHIAEDKLRHLRVKMEILNMERDSEVQRLRVVSSERETEVQQLRAEHSERELSNSTLQLIAQTELLAELRDDLLKFVRKFPMPDGAAKELRERLKALPCKAVDWEKFDTQFKSAHPEFTKKLLTKHPELSPTELRICSLVRMNLKSEDIARLLCLSERTVEDHRTNVRKKMKLKRAEDLMSYLVKL
jgi:tetratricopeptide (TPR) repeat protein/DNA-binding CsgD family transcriptional regulator